MSAKNKTSVAQAVAEKIDEARRLIDAHAGRQGLRWTKQRQAVLEAFLAARGHISVDELYDVIKETNPEIGPATVYRCMNLFTEAGVAKERRFNEGRVRYEVGVEVDHHDHLICTECGKIEEFEDERIERLQEEIARGRGFKVDHHRLELYGLCSGCAKAPK